MNRTTIIFTASIGLVVVALAFGVKDLASGEPPGDGDVIDPTTPIPFTPPAQPDGQPSPDQQADASCSPKAGGEAVAALEIGQVKASLSHAKFVRHGGDELFMALDIDVEEVALDERPPLNLALVIDRSGSMRGGPMQQAKNAARGLVTRLGPADRVALVTYDTGAEVVVPSTRVDVEGKQLLLAAIDRIGARGMTNIHKGLVLGYEELTRGISERAISRMVHLSDGQANVGVTDTPSLVRLASEAAARGIRTTSVGLGVHYNEHLMEALAEAGRGQYYYVRDGGSLDRVFAGELRNIQSTVATNVEVRLEPCAGTRIEKVYGLTSRREGTATVVSLADLAGGERRRTVVRVSTSPRELGRTPVLNAILSYDDADKRRGHRVMLALGAEAVLDPRVAEASVNRDVMAQVIEVQGALALRTATASFNRGDRTGAARHLEEQRQQMKQRAQRYQVERTPAARRASGTMDRFRGVFGASADALAGDEARDVALEAQVEARSMERFRTD